MLRVKKVIVVVSILFCTLCVYGSGAKIKKINIANNNRVPSTTILDYINVKVDDEYSDNLANKIIHNLYSTEFFDNIAVNYDSSVLNINLYESPLIYEVKFDGNSHIKSNDLEKIIVSYKGMQYHQAKLDRDIEKIIHLYNNAGRYLIAVKADKEMMDNNRVKIIFQISEGPKAHVKTINFIGNDNINSEVLKRKIISSEKSWYSFISSAHTYHPGKINFDKQSLVAYYKSQGFVDCQVLSVLTELSTNRRYLNITYNLDEGKQYKFGNLKFDSQYRDLHVDILKLSDNIKKGDIYNEDLVQQYKNRILNLLTKKGLEGGVVKITQDKNQNKNYIDLVFTVSTGPKKYINQINIQGNLKTHDNVIRREISLYEQDILSQSLIAEGIRKIGNLNFFQQPIKHSVTKSATIDGKYDINIAVEEKSTLNLIFNLGYDTSQGPVGHIQLDEANLGGMGNLLHIGYTKTAEQSKYSLGFTNPYFLNKNVSLGGRIFTSSTNQRSLSEDKTQYSQSSKGLLSEVKFNLIEDVNCSISYLFKNNNIKSNSGFVSNFMKEQQGEWFNHSLLPSITFNKLDNIAEPKDGYLLYYNTAISNISKQSPNDTINLFKNEVSGRYFHSLFKNKLTLKLAADCGNVYSCNDSRLRVVDRFNLGEPKLRGFKSDGIGPRLNNTSSSKSGGEPMGGTSYYNITTELVIPVQQERGMDLSMAMFIDAGSLWGLGNKVTKEEYGSVDDSPSLRVSVGAGVIIKTPMLPIRLDFAIPIKKEAYDKEQFISFSMSTRL